MTEFFLAAVAPLITNAFVQALGERLRQPIGEGFSHNRVVVVVLRFVRLTKLFEANAAGDCERANVIGQSCFLRRDEVGKRPAWLAAFSIGLLAEEVKSFAYFFAIFIRI